MAPELGAKRARATGNMMAQALAKELDLDWARGRVKGLAEGSEMATE
jgi:thiamine monophosphate kinase